MKFFVNSLQSRAINRSVDLRGLNAGVAKQFLDLPEIGTAGEHVGGEAVAQCVGADFGIDVGAQRVAFYQFPDRFAPQSFSGPRQQQPHGLLWIALSQQVRASFGQVISNGGYGSSTDGDHALFRSLAFDQTETIVEVNVGQQEIAHL